MGLCCSCVSQENNSVRDLFDQWAIDGQAEQAQKEHEYAVRQVLERWRWKPTDHYLDIGCGNGYTLRMVAPKVSRG